MTQEDKDLLLKDLCSRLPYRVLFKYKGEYGEEPEPQILFELNNVMVNTHYELEGCKPYLRPMSSMTEEEEGGYNLLQGLSHLAEQHWTANDGNVCRYSDAMDWLNSHHFDYRGLIEKGLAIEVTEEMYNNKMEE